MGIATAHLQRPRSPRPASFLLPAHRRSATATGYPKQRNTPPREAPRPGPQPATFEMSCLPTPSTWMNFQNACFVHLFHSRLCDYRLRLPSARFPLSSDRYPCEYPTNTLRVSRTEPRRIPQGVRAAGDLSQWLWLSQAGFSLCFRRLSSVFSILGDDSTCQRRPISLGSQPFDATAHGGWRRGARSSAG